MRLAPHSLLKALASAALLTSLGSYAATTTVQVVLSPPAPPAPEVNVAPKQDFATLLAQEDLRKQGITDPTRRELNDAVRSIEAQRASGMGWGEIAHSLGLKLGPVVSAANRAKHAEKPQRTEIADSRDGNNKNKKNGEIGSESKGRSKSDGMKGSETSGEKGGAGSSKGASDGGGSGSGSGKGNGNGNGNGGGSSGKGNGNGGGNSNGGGGKK